MTDDELAAIAAAVGDSLITDGFVKATVIAAIIVLFLVWII